MPRPILSADPFSDKACQVRWRRLLEVDLVLPKARPAIQADLWLKDNRLQDNRRRLPLKVLDVQA